MQTLGSTGVFSFPGCTSVLFVVSVGRLDLVLQLSKYVATRQLDPTSVSGDCKLTLLSLKRLFSEFNLFHWKTFIFGLY